MFEGLRNLRVEESFALLTFSLVLFACVSAQLLDGFLYLINNRFFGESIGAVGQKAHPIISSAFSLCGHSRMS